MRWPQGGIQRRIAVAAGIAAALAAVGAAPSAAKAPTPEQVAKACGSFLDTPAARPQPGIVPASVIADFGVLRQAQQPTDLPRLGIDGSELSGDLNGLSGYDPRLTRLVSTSTSQLVYLLVGRQPSPLPPPKCLRVMTTAQRRIYRAEARVQPAGPQYCLASVTASTNRSTGSFDCEPLALVGTGFAAGDIAAFGQDQTLAGLVPDGVGAVVLQFSGEAPIVGLVVNNVFLASSGTAASTPTPPHSTNRTVLRRYILAQLPQTVQWLSAPGGQVIRTFTPPTKIVNELVALFVAINSAAHSTGG